MTTATMLLGFLLAAQDDEITEYNALIKRLNKELTVECAETEHVALTAARSATREFGPHFETLWKALDGVLAMKPASKVEIEMTWGDERFAKGVTDEVRDGKSLVLFTPAWRSSFARAMVDAYLIGACGERFGDVAPALRAALKAWFAGFDGRVTAAAFGSLEPERHFMLAERTKHLLSKGKLPLGKRLWELKDADLARNDVAAWATGYALANGKPREALRAHLNDVAAGRKPPTPMTPAVDGDVKSFWSGVSLKVPDREDGAWWVAQSRYYTIRVEKGARYGKPAMDERAILRELKEKMDLIYGKYAQAFGYDDLLPRRPRVIFHKDEASYLRAGSPQGSVAYYLPQAQLLVAYAAAEGPKYVFETMCHEGCHQFFDTAFPGFYLSDNDASWFSEGLAECFAACEVRGSDMFIFTLSGGGADRLAALKSWIGETTPTRDLLTLSHQEFMRKADVHYAQAWAFCHFLWNAPQPLGGKGTYREVVIRLIDGFKRGLARDEAYKQAFVAGGRPIDLDRLHTEFVEYVKKLPEKKK